MNFYRFHLGDYAKKTSHLSPLDHGIYFLMLHAFYATEKPLPAGPDLYRICRANTKKERESVLKIVNQFWKSTDQGLINERALKEIEIHSKLAEISRINGAKGGRKSDPGGNLEETQRVPSGQPSANRFPVSSIQYLNKRKKTPPPPFQLPQCVNGVAWAKWIDYRKQRKPAVKPVSYPALAARFVAYGDDDRQMEVVEYSISEGYQGLIAPKPNGRAPPKPSQPALTLEQLEEREALAHANH